MSVLLLKVLFQTLVLYQVSQIVSESKISRPLREYLKNMSSVSVFAKVLHELMSCFLCTSVWVGFILTFILFDFAKYLGYDTISWFWNGLFFSALTWFMHVWEESKLKD